MPGRASSSGAAAAAGAGAGAEAGAAPVPVAARVRAVAFYAWTLAVAVPIFAVMLAVFLIVVLSDNVRRLACHLINKVWAEAAGFPFYGVEVEGLENLPPAEEAAVYVANHASFLDIFALFHLGRPFKFVSKTSNFLIPIIGWAMYLTGHIKLNRMDRRSQMRVLKDCILKLGEGASVLFFPEGTRTSTGKMGDFKKGAFSVAVKAGAPVVPVTLVGTGALLPNGREGELYPGKLKLVVHPKVQSEDAEELAAAARASIASALPAGTY